MDNVCLMMKGALLKPQLGGGLQFGYVITKSGALNFQN